MPIEPKQPTFIEKVFWPIISAFVAGIGVLVFQGLLAAYLQYSQNIIEFDKSYSNFSLPAAVVKNISENAHNPNDRISFRSFKITNVGSGDLINRSFNLIMPDVKSIGILEQPQANPNNASISYANGIITVRFNYLPSNSSGSFWFAASNYISDESLVLKNTSSGVTISNANALEARLATQFYIFIAAGITSIVVFFMLGFGLVTIRRSRDEMRALLINRNLKSGPTIEDEV